MLEVELGVHLDDGLDDVCSVVSVIVTRTLVEHHDAEGRGVRLGIDGAQQPAVHRLSEIGGRRILRSAGCSLCTTAVEVEPYIVIRHVIYLLGEGHHCTESILTVFIRGNGRVRSSVSPRTVSRREYPNELTCGFIGRDTRERTNLGTSFIRICPFAPFQI